ncbi:MAG: MotA/TolQ/ExbB proton channel family protein [Spirochaetota bacterium]
MRREIDKFSYFAIGFKKEPADAVTLKKGITFFTNMQKYLLFSGIIGMMIGIIAILAITEDPSKVGKGLSVASLTILYALVLSIAIAIPFKLGLEKKLAELG